MKGKLLSYEEIQKLKDGDKVWIEYKEDEFNLAENGVEQLVGDYLVDSNNCKVHMELVVEWYNEQSIKVYEWIEEPQPKTYKGSEIIHMIEEGILKDDDIIIEKTGEEFSIKDIKGNYFTTSYFLKYAPFTIKSKPVDFITAYNSHKKVKPEFGEYIYSDMKDFLEVIKDSSQDTADRLINGRWFIKQ